MEGQPGTLETPGERDSFHMGMKEGLTEEALLSWVPEDS